MLVVIGSKYFTKIPGTNVEDFEAESDGGENPAFRLAVNYFLTQISLCYKDFLQIFRFFTNTSIFYKNFDFLQKFRFFTKISIFYKKFDFL